jgi:hypothetical protein
VDFEGVVLFSLRFHVLDHEDFDEIENLYGLEIE